ncbi:MAG: 30S ribosomal protein S17 [Deltaproteobacteria bacterium]|nr:30S ribosomal protein S17 [Deltaproteobacteria bacterium]
MVEGGTRGSKAGVSGRGLSKVREGVVLSNKMDKTVVVSASRLVKHPIFKKYVRKFKKYYVHDEKNECRIGDVVQIVESRPISSLKRWRLREVVRKADEV